MHPSRRTGQRLYDGYVQSAVERPINDAESYFMGLQPGTPVRFATMLSAEEKQQRKQEGTLCAKCVAVATRDVSTRELMTIDSSIANQSRKTKQPMNRQEAVQSGMLTLNAMV